MTQNTETTAPVLVLASGNAGKIREFQAMFAPLGVRVAGQKEYGVSSCDEPYGTFIENCLAKARHAAKETGLPAMADDSGLCVDALGGAPGVFSARFAGEDGDDAANNRLLIEKMSGKTDRRAHYTCVLAAVRSADDPEPLIAEGFWQGEIAEAPAGTGGFGIKNNSMADYSPYLQNVCTVFMALFGVNFSIYFFLLQKKFDLALKNTELRWYVGIILASIALITANVLPMYPSFHAAVHHAAFSVSSVITTTGFCTENFDLWPEFSRVILAFLMIVGASAGSTGGGLKVSRLVILIRAAQVEVRRLIHPRTVKVMRIDGKPVGQDTVRAVSGYLILYVLICMVSVLLVSLDGFDGSTTITAVLATFINIGPGLGLAGPVGNFAMFSPLSKLVLCLDMLFGRLELYPMVILLLPSTWNKRQ